MTPFLVPSASGRLLAATGRKAGLAGIGAGAIRQDEHAGYLKVDEHMQAAPAAAGTQDGCRSSA